MVNDFLTQTNVESVPPPGQAPQQHATIVSGTGREGPHDTGGGMPGKPAGVGAPTGMWTRAAQAESLRPGIAGLFRLALFCGRPG